MSDTPAPLPAVQPDPPTGLKSPILPWLAAGLLAVIVYFGIVYLVDIFTHESTDDAFIAGHIISLAPRIAGQITAVHVLDNQMVSSNDLLVEIDPADYQIALAQKQAAADSQQASYKTMLAGWQLAQDLDRATALRTQKTISQSEFDAAQATARQAAADAQSARENITEAASKVEEADRTLDAALAQSQTVLAQWNEAQTNTAVARQNLSYTKIFAPAAGRVTRKAVEAGDYVQTGQQLLNLVPTEVWVFANFKESQLKDMQPGQPVSVAIDALGGRTFAAHVDSIQAGSGAQFSLLPPENATGNFVKVIQRVPVTIVFDDPLPAGHVIGPGLSVTPSVQVSKFVFPAWAIVLIALVVAGKSLFLYFFMTGRKTPAK